MTPHRIRLAFNTRRPGETYDTLTGRAPTLPRGYTAQIEVCLMDLAEMADITDISTLTLRCVPIADLDATALFTVTLAAVNIDENVTLEEWNDEDGQHGIFQLTATQTAQSLGGASEAYFRFLVTATTTDGDTIQWGFANVRFVETGKSATTAPEDPEDYETAAVADAKYQLAKTGYFWAPNVDTSGNYTGKTTPWRTVLGDDGIPRLQPGTPEDVLT